MWRGTVRVCGTVLYMYAGGEGLYMYVEQCSTCTYVERDCMCMWSSAVHVRMWRGTVGVCGTMFYMYKRTVHVCGAVHMWSTSMWRVSNPDYETLMHGLTVGCGCSMWLL